MSKNIKHEIRTAILVDGGFYRQRARYLFGAKPLNIPGWRSHPFRLNRATGSDRESQCSGGGSHLA